MGKTLFIAVMIFLALGLMVYNIFLINFKAPLQGDSGIALIGVLASLCAVVLLLIFSISQRIQDKDI